MIQIRYFGTLREQLKTDQESLDWSGASSDDLLILLRQRGPIWQKALAPENIFKVAINHVLIHKSCPIPDGAEVGLLPPVTGG